MIGVGIFQTGIIYGENMRFKPILLLLLLPLVEENVFQ